MPKPDGTRSLVVPAIKRADTMTFGEFLAALSASNADLQGWADEQLAGITSRILLVQGDRDFVTVEHAALMLELIPTAQLAILPDTTHMQVTHRTDELLPMLTRFLAAEVPTTAG